MGPLPLTFGIMIAAFLGVLGLALIWLMVTGKIDLKTLISEPKNPDGTGGDASMSRFQFLIFTFVISFCLLYVIFQSQSFPEIPASILGLLGISGGTYAISKGIQTARDAKEQTQAAATGPKPGTGAAAPKADATQTQPVQAADKNAPTGG
jgi:uncharacterized BrkB/YihY/UPF0761 family membrane protein